MMADGDFQLSENQRTFLDTTLTSGYSKWCNPVLEEVRRGVFTLVTHSDAMLARFASAINSLNVFTGSLSVTAIACAELMISATGVKLLSGSQSRFL